MTREEEIQKLIDEENGIDNYGSSDYQIGVCDGVRLADKTMLDEVCKWLENDCDIKEYLGGIFSGTCSVNFDWEKLSDNLRKAMEE